LPPKSVYKIYEFNARKEEKLYMKKYLFIVFAFALLLAACASNSASKAPR
jgi:hypothetical protein